MSDFIGNGASVLPAVKSDLRTPTGATTEVKADDLNQIRQALLDVRTQEITNAQDISSLALGTPSASSALVTATGSSTARSLAARAADVRNVRDGFGATAGAVGDGTTDDSAAVSAVVGSTAGSIIAPAGTYKLVTPVALSAEQLVSGVGLGTSFKPSTEAFTFTTSATGRWYSGLRDLKLDGSASSSHLVKVVGLNSAGGPSQLTFRDIQATGWAANKAAFFFTNAHPYNTYGHLLFNVNAYGGSGHGWWVQNSGGTQGSSVYTAIHNTLEGNLQHGAWFDVSGGGKPGLVNMIGNNLQGNTLSPLQVDGVSGLNLLGNYFEQAHLITTTPLVFSGTSPSPGISIIGNGITGEANYGVDFNGTFAIEAVVSHSNVFSGQATAAYRVTNLQGATLGPDKLPAGKPSVDWAGSAAWKMLQAWDISAGTWSFTSDGTYYDQPWVGFGVKNTSIAAYVDIAGRQPSSVSSGNGTAATRVLNVTGPVGGNTTDATGKSAGAGSDVYLVAGAGGTAPAGSTNGNGGNIIIRPGLAGGGAGTAGVDGSIGLDGGINRDSTGFKHKRLTTGSIGATTRADVTWTISPAFRDANYTAIATVYDSSGSGTGLRVERIRTQTASSIVVQVMNDSAGSLTGTLEIIAIHD